MRILVTGNQGYIGTVLTEILRSTGYKVIGYEDISSIIYNNCTECHREGEIGAFLPLTNYEDVYNNRNWILSVISIDEDYRHGEPIMPFIKLNKASSSEKHESSNMFAFSSKLHALESVHP